MGITADLNELDGEAKEKLSEVEKAVTMKAQDMAGVTAPLGFFDPLGFTTDAPEGKLLFFRECEVKHGRVAMLASLGILVGEQFHPLLVATLMCLRTSPSRRLHCRPS